MTSNGVLQLVLFVGTVLVLVKPLGLYMARVYRGEISQRFRLVNGVEQLLYRISGIEPTLEMTWRHYSSAVLWFSVCGFLMTYGVQRFQQLLPLNPQSLPGISPDSAFNTAVSFVTNTNWQSYSGEVTMSYLTQMVVLTVQNFLSAGTGLAVVIAFTRGFSGSNSQTIGNFWQDLVRSVLYILLPMSAVLALALISQGVVQTFKSTIDVQLVEQDPKSTEPEIQGLSVGPVASQLAIKQLGTNGGGFFNANSSHPFENPTAISNFLQLVSILLIPAALCFTFGELVQDRRQGWAILGAMSLIFLPLLLAVVYFEQQGNPRLDLLQVEQVTGDLHSGGNMEGKETRFGIVNSAMWAASTTAASNGSVNSMHDSYTPLSGLAILWLIQTGEVIFGGVGSGLYGIVIYAMIAVFIAGLMVGRTPEYLGKKIGAFEIKMCAITILCPCALVLVGTAVGVMTKSGRDGILNPGAHGFSEVLYAFSSAGNNNGSAFAGLSANTPFYNAILGFSMLVGRFWVMLPVLAIAGSLSRKPRIPAGAGTLPTHTVLFAVLLSLIVIVVGALSYFPALALGPLIEHLQMHSL